MVVGIDLRCLPSDGSAGAGVAHAARALVRAMLKSDINVDVAWKMFVPDGATWEEGKAEVIRIPDATGHALRTALTAHPCERLFVPSGSVPPGLRIPAIPWVHDLAIFDHPEWFAQPWLRRMATTRMFLHGVRNASHVLAVSEATKAELVRIARLDPRRVTVTGEGGDSVLAFLSENALTEAKRGATGRLATSGLTQPYILFLGTLEPRKNIHLLLEAWLRAQRQFRTPIDLVVAGRDGWKLNPIHRALATASGLSRGRSRLVRLSTVSDDDRRDLLLAAALVAVPSHHEGFGLVALEAMQAGTAVIASSVGGHREVVGSAGGLLAPSDTRLWSHAIAHLMNDEQSRKHLADRGKIRSREMTWELAARIALQTLTQNA